METNFQDQESNVEEALTEEEEARIREYELEEEWRDYCRAKDDALLDDYERGYWGRSAFY